MKTIYIMKKITETQLRQIIRSQLKEIFGFGSPKRLKTTSPFGDKIAVLIGEFNFIQDKYKDDPHVKRFASLLQDMIYDADEEAYSKRFF